MRPDDQKAFYFEGFTLDLRRGCLRGEDGEIELRPKSFEVLRYLTENAGRLVPKDEIIKAVWPTVIVTDESLARCVSDIRLALGDREQRIIRTLPRRGYLFAVAISESEPSLAPVQRAAAGPSPDVAVIPQYSEDATPAISATQGSGSAASIRRSAERRQLTVMACELVGLAALSARLDPEDFQRALADCREKCAVILDRHGGYTARHLDDGLLVYFGYPHAREHDAEQAARAGLALLDMAEQLSADRQTPLQFRIGVATGIVVVADETASGEAREPIAVGEAPHLARQLQAKMEAGELVVDQTTHRLLGGLFDYRGLSPLALDGQPTAVPAWRVLKASQADNRFEARHATDGRAFASDRSLSEREHDDGLTPFVGRAKEIEVLAGCLDRTADEIMVIDIVGEPGIGKSRLLHEFRRRLAGSRTRIWPGNCWPDDQQMPFRPFIDVVRRTFRLSPDESEADVARKLMAGLALFELATEANLALLLNLLGLPPPPGGLRGLDDVLVGLRTRELLLQLVREGARTAPVVMILEDLHWIDNASQDLLARVISTVDIGALTIVHTRRPDYRPPWAGGAHTTTLALEPLTAAETSRIVHARLGDAEVTAPLERLIAERAEGNPLFAEEIANFLLERGLLRRAAASLDYDGTAVAAAVPTSVQSLLTARVDRLAPGDRSLLQAAAVVGRRFAPDFLAAVTRAEGVEARLRAMEALDLVRHTGEEFVFKHAMVRDALYAGLLHDQRRALHFAIASEIERRNDGRVSEVADILAHHYARADHKEKAVEYLALAGRKSLGIYSLDEAEYSLKTALDFARSHRGERMDTEIPAIMVDLAIVYYLQFKTADQIALIEPELQRIDALGDTKEVPILLDLYGHALFTSGRFHEGRRVEDKALAIAERLSDRRSRAHARAGVILLSIYVDPMPLQEFESFARRAFDEADDGEGNYLVARMMMVIGLNYLHRGLNREARQWAFRLMAFGRSRRDRRAQGAALWLLGWLDIVVGDYASALDHGEECEQTALAPFDRLMGQHVVGTAQLMLGRVAEGTATIQQNMRHAIANGSRSAVLTTECALGVSMLFSGDLKKGVRRLEATIRRSESEFGYRVYADWTRICLAEFYLALLQGTKRPTLRSVLKQPLFLAFAKQVAAKRSEELLLSAKRNSQFDARGVFRARIDYDLGLLYKALGNRELARTHFCDARGVAHAQEAATLVAKIDAAETTL